MRKKPVPPKPKVADPLPEIQLDEWSRLTIPKRFFPEGLDIKTPDYPTSSGYDYSGHQVRIDHWEDNFSLFISGPNREEFRKGLFDLAALLEEQAKKL